MGGCCSAMGAADPRAGAVAAAGRGGFLAVLPVADGFFEPFDWLGGGAEEVRFRGGSWVGVADGVGCGDATVVGRGGRAMGLEKGAHG